MKKMLAFSAQPDDELYLPREQRAKVWQLAKRPLAD